jgi:hypothetical protein
MWKGFTILLAVALAAVSCSQGVSRMRTQPLPGPNPTTYSFPLPVEEVHARALHAFSYKHQRGEPIFTRPASADHWESTLRAECSTNAIIQKALFADPANAHDVYLYSARKPIAISPVYRGRYGGLPFVADFHLHLTGNASDTVVTVRVSDPEIVNGKRWTIGPCGPVNAWNSVKVRPTTVEEYTVISYLGRHLGITNMPPVILPPQ